MGRNSGRKVSEEAFSLLLSVPKWDATLEPIYSSSPKGLKIYQNAAIFDDSTGPEPYRKERHVQSFHVLHLSCAHEQDIYKLA